jgi:hypothetical protein
MNMERDIELPYDYRHNQTDIARNEAWERKRNAAEKRLREQERLLSRDLTAWARRAPAAENPAEVDNVQVTLVFGETVSPYDWRFVFSVHHKGRLLQREEHPLLYHEGKVWPVKQGNEKSTLLRPDAYLQNLERGLQRCRHVRGRAQEFIKEMRAAGRKR